MTTDTYRKTPVSLQRCTFCGSDNIFRHIRLNQNADVMKIGLTYQAGMVFLGTESLYADLCEACGSVVRLYVDATGKRWVTK